MIPGHVEDFVSESDGGGVGHYEDIRAGEGSRGLGAFVGFTAGRSLAPMPACVSLLNTGLAPALSPVAGATLHVPHRGVQSPP